MKIISWNCNGAFRKKFQLIDELNADIIVVQECENPEIIADKTFKSWANNYLWTSDNKNKGLCIFCKNQMKIIDNEWKNDGNKYFISANYENQFDIVAVWNHTGGLSNYKYIGQFWKYLQINKSKFSNCIILGDFNSNKIWDKKRRFWNHSDVVKELEEIGVVSLYHNYFKEKQGEEKRGTFYLQKKMEKEYHIDYVFTNNKLINRINEFEIGEKNKWLQFSDHLPIIFHLNL